MNKVILIGRLCANPDVRHTNSGITACNVRVAVQRKYANKNTGEKETDFINCFAFGKTAELIEKYFTKGNRIVIEGDLRNNDYTDKDGVKHYSMVVKIENVEFCENKSSGANSQDSVSGNNAQSTENDPDIHILDLGEFEDILSDETAPF